MTKFKTIVEEKINCTTNKTHYPKYYKSEVISCNKQWFIVIFRESQQLASERSISQVKRVGN